MSNRYNELVKTRNSLADVMMTCWREGRKLITTHPEQSEVWFVIGETCKELISKIQDSINEEVQSWEN
jgi:hypothetical protein